MSPELKEAIQFAAGQIEACAAVRAIYARLQTEIDHRKPVCVASGKCCHFESYGHRLYVTTLELAAFFQDLQKNGGVESPAGAGSSIEQSGSSAYLRTGVTALPQLSVQSDGCPLQVGKLCGVHAIRPFGCRIFFCDPTATDWQQQLYELFHTELQQLHERFEVPYLYVEWRQALAALEIFG